MSSFNILNDDSPSELSIIKKYQQQQDVVKAILNKTLEHFKANKELIIATENKMYGVAVVDNHIYNYTENDLKELNNNPKVFIENIYAKCYKLAIYSIITSALEKTNAKTEISKSTRARLIEKNALKKTIKQFLNFGLFENEEAFKQKAYDYYNNTYNEQLDINSKNLFNDIKVVNIYTMYICISANWSVYDANILSNHIYNNK